VPAHRSFSPAARPARSRRLVLTPLEDRLAPAWFEVVSMTGSWEMHHVGSFTTEEGQPPVPVNLHRTGGFVTNGASLASDGGTGTTSEISGPPVGTVGDIGVEGDITTGYSGWGGPARSIGIENRYTISGSVRLVPSLGEPDGTEVSANLGATFEHLGAGGATFSAAGFSSWGQHPFTAVVGEVYDFSLQGTADAHAGTEDEPDHLGSYASLYFSVNNPTINLTANAGGPYTITEGQSLTLDASGTTYNGFGQLEYDWDVNGDGLFGDATGVNPTLSWAQLVALDIEPGEYFIQLAASDGRGLESVGDAVLTVEPAAFGMTVTADGFDDDARPDFFGPYLPGVDLNVSFAVAVTDPANKVVAVKYSVAGRPAQAAKPAGPKKWKFAIGPGGAPAGDYSLTVTAYDRQKWVVGTPFQGTVQLTGRPDFELQVAPQGQGAPADVEDVRFLRKIAAPMTFHGTIAGLPSYYKDRLQVRVGDTNVPVQAVASGGDVTFRFDRGAAGLPAGRTPVTVRVASVPLSKFGDAAEPIVAVAVPDWMKKGLHSFDPATRSYRLEAVEFGGVKKAFAAPKTGVKWVDEKLGGSSLDVTPVLNVVAPLAAEQDVTFSDSRLRTKAVVLGRPVWSQSYGAAALDIGGTLDRDTLEAEGLYVRLKDDLDLGTVTFLDESISFNLLPHLPSVLAEADLTLALKIEGALSVNGGVQVRSENGKVIWEEAGTFVRMTATATGEATAALNASLLSGFVGEVTGRIALFTTLTVAGEVRFGGATVPKPTTGSLSAVLTGHYEYQVKGTLAAGAVRVVDINSTTDEEGIEDDRLKPITVLKLPG
ncbi:MAG TPA: hypothetical protein VM597_28685, partial [Gemmataceae bacterium]|nr:hypothetical protein [Gemmataceae bacterium]